MTRQIAPILLGLCWDRKTGRPRGTGRPGRPQSSLAANNPGLITGVKEGPGSAGN